MKQQHHITPLAPAIFVIYYVAFKIASFITDDKEKQKRYIDCILYTFLTIGILAIASMIIFAVINYQQQPSYEEKYPIQTKTGTIEDIEFHQAGIFRDDYYEITYDDGTIHRYDDWDMSIKEGNSYTIQYRDDGGKFLVYEGYEEVK